ncbi:MAG: TonB-dependent receptor [Longimicrobiales bacterium]
MPLAGLLLASIVALAPARLTAQAPPQRPPRQFARIIGTIVDAGSNRPLPAARARLVERHTEEPAHEDGSFEFTGLPAGSYTLMVEHLGYDRHTVELTLTPGSTESVLVALHARPIPLDEIVTTGAISRRSGRDVLSPMSVLSGAALDRALDGTVAGTLDAEPGLAVTSIGPTTGQPVIRGLGGDRIVVLEDGVRTGDMASTSGDHAIATDPITAEQIEVVRGPMSLLYGSSALGGVINIVRGEVPAALPEHAHGSAVITGSSVSRGITGGGHATTSLGSFALRAEASASTSSDFDTPDGRLENTDTRVLNVAAGASRIGSWGHAGGSYRYYNNRYGIPGGFVGGHERGVDIEMWRHTARGEIELHRGENSFLSTIRATGSFSDYHHQEFEQSGSVGTEFFQELASGEVSARHGPRGALAEGAIGVRAQYRDIQTGGSLRTPSTYDYAFAGFIVEEIGQSDLRLQLGLRYDWARYVPRETTATITVAGERIPIRPRSFGSASGSAGLLYSISDALRAGASVARAYRTPNFNELYSDGPHLAANSYDVGDPSLGSETGFGVDAFVRINTTRVRGEVAAFRNQLNDYLFPSSRGRAIRGRQGGRPLFQYTNEDAVFTGAEANLAWSVSNHLVLETTASYVRARFTSDLAPIPVIEGTDTTFTPTSEYPPLIPPLNGNIELRYDRPLFFVGAGMRWAARQDRLGDFETPTAAYAVGDLSAGLRLTQGARLHMITLGVDNILDAEHRDHLSRIKDLMPQPGRNLRLVYRLSF